MYWVYDENRGPDRVFYTDCGEMTVTNSAKEIRSQYHVNASTRDVSKSSTVPHPNTGGRAIYITANSAEMIEEIEDLGANEDFLKCWRSG